MDVWPSASELGGAKTSNLRLDGSTSSIEFEAEEESAEEEDDAVEEEESTTIACGESCKQDITK